MSNINKTILSQLKIEQDVLELLNRIKEKDEKRAKKLSLKQSQDLNTENEQQMDLKIKHSIFDLATFGKENDSDDDSLPYGYLKKLDHGSYLKSALHDFRHSIKPYDCGHPWIIFWITRAIQVLNEPSMSLNETMTSHLLHFLKQIQHPNGSYGGGNYQYPQLAQSYAAICSLVELGSQEGLESINRQGIYNFLMQCRDKTNKGAFVMCEGGENDMRGVYIAVVLANLLNIMTEELMDGVVEFIASSQTYEGGIGPEPFTEAHGGLSFCGFAALAILNKARSINLDKFIYWLSNKQMELEGGFQGRTNKLADNCYSYWQGATFRLIAEATNMAGTYNNELLYDQMKLQSYILLCQDDDGGLFDKPGKFPDLYHTCYSLCGLSSAQYSADGKEEFLFEGIKESKTNKFNIAFNLSVEKLNLAKEYFYSLPKINQIL